LLSSSLSRWVVLDVVIPLSERTTTTTDDNKQIFRTSKATQSVDVDGTFRE